MQEAAVQVIVLSTSRQMMRNNNYLIVDPGGNQAVRAHSLPFACAKARSA
jgi:hypothetical protein